MRLKNMWGILFFLCLIYAMSLFHRASPSVISLDIMKSLSLTPISFGLIGSATMLGYALTQLPAGILTDKFGARKTLLLYQIVACVAALAFAFSPQVESAVLSRFILGLALAANVPAMKVLAEWFPPSAYSKAVAILLASGALGGLLASSPLAFATEYFGWRYALVAFTLLSGLLAFFTFTSLADSPKKEIQKQIVTSLSLKKIIIKIFQTKNFLPCFIYFFFMVGTMFTIGSTWWGAYLQQALHFTRGEAGIILSIMALIPIIITPLTAVISDKIKNRTSIIRLGACIEVCCFIPLVFFPEKLSINTIIIIGFIINSIIAACASLIFTITKESVEMSIVATSFGLMNTGAPICAFIMQNCVGLIIAATLLSDNSNILTSYGTAYSVILGGLIIALLASFKIKDTLKV